MGIDRWHGSRPEGARGSSVARLAGYRRHFPQVGSQALKVSLQAGVGILVDQAMAAALASETRDDNTFGDYASVFGFCRSAVMQEGRLLEDSIALAVRRHTDLMLLPPKPMPIVPAAQEMLKRTPSDEIKGIRFPSRVHATESYRPDLFVVNRAKHSGLILDAKRSLPSYRPQEIDRLRFRMLAVAAIASEWIVENRGPLLVSVETAIVDGADEISDHERGVFRLSEIDELLGTDGTSGFVKQVREGFSRRVQEELERRCRTVLGHPVRGGPGAAALNPSTPSAEVSPPCGEVIGMKAAGPTERRFGYAQRPGLH
jgi:hypothetical protein